MQYGSVLSVILIGLVNKRYVNTTDSSTEAHDRKQRI
jgi:hypothetical protein